MLVSAVDISLNDTELADAGWISETDIIAIPRVVVLSPLVLFRLPPPELGVDWEAAAVLSLFDLGTGFFSVYPPNLPEELPHPSSLPLRLRSHIILQDILHAFQIYESILAVFGGVGAYDCKPAHFNTGFY